VGTRLMTSGMVTTLSIGLSAAKSVSAYLGQHELTPVSATTRHPDAVHRLNGGRCPVAQAAGCLRYSRASPERGLGDRGCSPETLEC